MDNHNGMRHVALVGEMTVFNAGAIRQQLLGALDEANDLDVDLSLVTEIDTAGVQLILAARREAEARRKAVRFSGGNPVVLDVMALLGLSSLLAESAPARPNA